MNNRIHSLAQEVGLALAQKQATLTTAESCTGGGISQVITSISGSSAWFNCSFVTYSNQSKYSLLGVDLKLIEQEGAVSESVVCAMAQGALIKAAATIAVAVSGIAGPDGGTHDKPVGTVWLAWALASGEVAASRYQFNGDRERVRQQAVCAALQGVLERV